MNFPFPCLFLALLLIAGCSDDGDREVVDPAGPPKRVDKPKPVEREIVREEPRFASNDRKLEEIMDAENAAIAESLQSDETKARMAAAKMSKKSRL